MQAQGRGHPRKRPGVSAGLSLSLIRDSGVCLRPFSLYCPFMLHSCPGETYPCPAPEFISPSFKSLANLRLASPTSGPRLVSEEGAQPSSIRHPLQVPPRVVWRVGATLKEELPGATGNGWAQGQDRGDRAQRRGSRAESQKVVSPKGHETCLCFLVHSHHLHADHGGGDHLHNQSFAQKEEKSKEQKA